MTNHIMYFKKSDNFWALWLNVCDFFLKYNKTAAFNHSETENKHATNFQKKMYSEFEKI